MESGVEPGVLIAIMHVLAGVAAAGALQGGVLAMTVTPRSRPFWFYAVLCLVVAGVQISVAAYHTAATEAAAILAQKWLNGLVLLFPPFIYAFVAVYTRQARVLRLGLLIAGLCLALEVANVVLPLGIRFGHIDSFDLMAFPWGERLHLLRGEPSAITVLARLLFLIVFVWGLKRGYTLYRLGMRLSGALIAAGFLMLLVSWWISALVDHGRIGFVYPGGFGFIAFVVLIAVIVSRDFHESQIRLRHLSYHDTLTDLPNRELLMDRLGHSLAMSHRYAHPAALLVFNIDRFKTLNTARGHGLGDKILIAVSERVSAHLGGEDTLARLGADEFAILLNDVGETSESAGRCTLAVAEKIQADLRRPFHVGMHGEITLSASLGITLCPGRLGDTPLEALRRAETALQRAKEIGGGKTAFFDTSMGETAEQRFQIERELRNAIAGGELRLYLQPQVDAAGRLVGAEALVRWQHPERGLLAPMAFIPIAEETHLIVDLSSWVCDQVCAILARENLAGRPLRISVNLSPRHFRLDGFVVWIKDLLAAHGADPSHLTLEVTEGLMIDNVNEVAAKMSELGRLGVHFSIDDFGTGYSSLTYLKRLPIHELKIDKAFVQDAPHDPDDAVLVETILAMARHLHLRVVAEGVETLEQAAFLNQRAEVVHQGYLYGRPEPAEIWIERWHRSADA